MGRGGGKGGGGRSGGSSRGMNRIVGEATFGGQQTLGGQKLIPVYAEHESNLVSGINSSVGLLLELRKRDSGWEIWIPRTYTGSLTKGTLPPTPISSARSLRDAKTLASRLIRDARTVDRIESLRYATKKPRWLRE